MVADRARILRKSLATLRKLAHGNGYSNLETLCQNVDEPTRDLEVAWGQLAQVLRTTRARLVTGLRLAGG